MSKAYKLQFNEAIISTVNNPISLKVLLKRLANLSDELSSIDQDHCDTASLTDITKQLVNKKLRHNDHGIQSYVALCIAEILRLYAPDAPYTAAQLTDIFKLFLKMFKNLASAPDTAPYYQQNFQLIKNLADVRSIILMTDLPKSDQLIESLFNLCYNELGKSRDLDPKLVPIISDILSEIISESDSISQSVLKMILSKFLSNAASVSGSQKPTILSSIVSSNPAFAFTIAICENNPERMSRQVAQFFSEVLYENYGQGLDEDEAYDSDSNSKNPNHLNAVSLKNLVKIHKLLEEIWKYVPEILSSVMGFIDSELSADNEKIRVLATESVGHIVEFLPSKLSFIATHNETWNNWTKKILDSSAAVRTKWIQIASKILTSRFDLIQNISNGIVKALIDTDEKVRLNAVRSVAANLPGLIFLAKFSNNLTILNTLGQLAREKNQEIRNESIKLLTHLYNLKFEELLDEEELSELSEGDNEADITTTGSLRKLIGWIPDHIISLIYINAKSINYLVDVELIEHIFTTDSNTTSRVQRLLYIIANLNEKSRTAFWAINKRQIQLSSVILQFLKMIEVYHSSNRPLVEQKLEKTINWLVATLPDELNSFNVFIKFVKLNNKRFSHLIKLCLLTDSSIDTIKNSFKELFAKMSDSKVISTTSGNDDSVWSSDVPVTTTEFLETWKLTLYRASVIYYNKSNINAIMQFAKDENSKYHRVSSQLIEQISTALPKVFESHIDELVQLMSQSDVSSRSSIDTSKRSSIDTYKSISTDTTRQSIPDVKRQSIIDVKQRNNESLVNTLKTLYHFFVKYPQYLPLQNDGFIHSIVGTVTDGTPLEAKYAVRLLRLVDDQKSDNYYLKKIVGTILPLNKENFKFPTHLSVISELFLQEPELIELEASDITSYAIKEVLLTNHTLADPEQDPAWITDEELELANYDNCYAKMLALEVFVNRLKFYENHNLKRTESGKVVKLDSSELANLVLKLLISCIGNGGELVASTNPTYPTPTHFQARLRLAAGLMLLELSKLPTYNKMLKPSTINRLVYLIQDENVEIRKNFIKYLETYLNDELISQRYLPLIFFAAHEPDLQLRNNVKTWIQSSFASQLSRSLSNNDIGFEKAFVRLLHMIGHHQEFVDLINQASKKPEENKTNEDESPKEKSDSLLFQAYAFAVQYILFFLENVLTQDNISLLFYFSNRVKQYRDALISDFDYDLADENQPPSIYNIYRIADLSSLAIKLYRMKRNWVIQTFPGKLQLSKDLFAPMKSTVEAQTVASKVFIPESLEKKLELFIRNEIGLSHHHPHFNGTKKSNGTGIKRLAMQSGKKYKPTKKQKSFNRESEPLRKSGRMTKKINYADSSSETEEEDEILDASIADY